MANRLAPWGFFALVALAAGSLAGCGGPLASAVTSPASTSLTAAGVPPQSAFVVIKARVSELLPDDNVGLPHQNFIVKLENGTQYYTVNNDTKYGTKVPNLKVGLVMTVRGTTYGKPGRMGIHWTHHASQVGDAGYIQTADGRFE